MRTLLLTTACAFLALAGAASADASFDLSGKGAAKVCAEGAALERTDPITLSACNEAVQNKVKLGRKGLAGAYANRAIVYMQRGNFEAAEADLEKALKLKPDLGEARQNLGSLYMRQARFNEALDTLNDEMTLNSANPARVYYARGVAYENMQDFARAYENYSKASELDPAWAAPRHGMKRYELQMVSQGTPDAG